MQQNNQSLIIYHRNILKDKSKSPEMRENSRKLLMELLKGGKEGK